MNSDYASVTQQAGIYAGEGGFTVHVEDNTHLTGSLLDSTASADKNSLTTGTLTMEDLENKAAYDVKNTGVSYHHYSDDRAREDNFNQSGLTPSISPGAKDEASSVTQAAIAPGTITTTKEQTDLSQINRNTADALHKLDHIFDKNDIQERQELAQLFSKNANELLHQYDTDGSLNKSIAHGIVAEISSQIAGNGAGSGFTAGFTNELLIHKIKDWSHGDPATAQWISAALGAAVNQIGGGSAESGASAAQDGTKWNAEALPWFNVAGLTEAGASILSYIKAGGIVGVVLSGEQVAGGDAPEELYIDSSSWGSYPAMIGTLPYYGEAQIEEAGSYEYHENTLAEPEAPIITSHYETDKNGVRVIAYSDGTYEATNTFEKDGSIYTIAGLDKHYQIYGMDANGNTAYLDGQYYIDEGRTATSTGKRDEYGHLIGIANDTGETVMLNDWVLPDGTHAWYDRDNAYTGEVIVTDGKGEYTTSQVRSAGLAAGVVGAAAAGAMPPNKSPNPQDGAEMVLQSQQQTNNQNEYSNDTSFLYTKNVGKALLEQTLNRIGGKYGASHLGTAAVTGSGVVEDYLQGKTAEEVLIQGGFSWGAGKFGQVLGKATDLDSTITSILGAAMVDTVNDKKDNKKEKQEVISESWGENK